MYEDTYLVLVMSTLTDCKQISAVSDLMHLAPLRLLQVAERGGGWRNGEGGGGVNESCRQTKQSLHET